MITMVYQQFFILLFKMNVSSKSLQQKQLEMEQ